MRHVLTTLEGDDVSDASSLNLTESVASTRSNPRSLASSASVGSVTGTANAATRTASTTSPLLWLALGGLVLYFASRKG